MRYVSTTGGETMKKFSYNEEALKNLKITDTSILDRLVDADSARRHHLNKDRSHRDKRLSLREAIGEYVHDNDIMTDGGFCYVRTSIQSYFEIMRQGKKNLQAISSPNTNHSYMINAGVCSYSHNSYLGAEMRGVDRNYQRQLKNKRVTILSEWSHGTMAQGFKAAQLGVPGIFSKQLLGSDILKYNPFVRVMNNPIADEDDPVVYIPALYPDVTIIHVHAADRFGNARFFGPSVNDIAMAAASRKVIITAEEIVPPSDIRNNNKGVVIPFMYVDAVVELPYGGVPGSMPGCYYWSRQWWETVFKWVLTSDENVQKFLQYWVYDCKDQFDFIEKLGGARWLSEARRQTKAAEYDNEDLGFDFNYEPFNRKEWNPGDRQKYY